MANEVERLRQDVSRLAAELEPGAAERLEVVARELGELDSHTASSHDEEMAAHRRRILLRLSALPTSSLQNMLEQATRITAEALDADFAKVLEALPDGDLLVRAGYGWPEGVVGRTRDAASSGSQAGYTLLAGTPVVIEDLTREERFSVPEVARRLGVTSSASAPIPGKYRSYGVLEVDSKARRSYSPAEVRFLTIAANIIGAHISLVRTQRALYLQQGVSLALTEAATVEEAAPQCLRTMGEALDFQAAALWWTEADGSAAKCGISWTARSLGHPHPEEGRTVRGGEDIVGRVLRERRVLWSSDLAADPRFFQRREVLESGLAARICVPVFGRHRVLAVIDLFKDEPFEPDADMLATLRAVAHQLGGFIERVQAERLLRAREREFRALVENSPDAIGRFDRDFRLLYLNPSVKRLVEAFTSHAGIEEGYSNTSFFELVREHPGVSLEEWEAAVRSAFETGQEQTREVKVELRDGEHVLQCRIVPEFDEDGSVASVLSIGRDVTDLVRAQEAATHRYEQLRALVQAAPVGMVVADAQTNSVILANREFERLVDRSRRPGDPLDGVPRQVVCRRVDGSAVQPDDLPLRRALYRGETVHAEELIMEHPNGMAFPTVSTAAPVLDGQGNVVAAILILQDITSLRQLDRLRTDILGMVGHELRTPLAIIRLAVSSMLVDPDAVTLDDVKETLETIDGQAVRMAAMVTNLRDMAQIEAGAFSIQKDAEDLGEVLRQAQDDMARTGVENIVLNIPEGLARVPMDRLRLLQVVENLLTNAAKYGTPGAPITVDVEDGASEVTLHVRNFGPGIPEERHPNLFQKFSRLGRSRSETGSGLGLAICKGIVEAHGGRIWVDSSADAPVTTFIFTLPLERAGGPGQPEENAWSPAGQGARPRGRGRVLIVDDEPQVLRHLKRVLERSGYETLATGDPASVPDVVRQEHPRLVLLDIKLPGVSGFDVFERIRPFDVPVIFVTGSDAREDREHAHRLGVEAYLTKPVPTKELLARVGAALEKRGPAHV